MTRRLPHSPMRPRKPVAAQVPDRIRPATTGRGYQCPELTVPAVRPGAGNAQEFPSRIGDRLHYRDGRITDLQGNALEAWQA